jgi:hypothetical protein
LHQIGDFVEEWFRYQTVDAMHHVIERKSADTFAVQITWFLAAQKTAKTSGANGARFLLGEKHNSLVLSQQPEPVFW